MKIKMLVCGATGFIGRNIAEHYAGDERYEVHATCFNNDPYTNPHIIWHLTDLREPIAVDLLLEGMDIVIQAAATTSGSKDIIHQPHIHVTDNAVMNSYIFRAAVKQKVKHLVFLSCTVMYSSSNHERREQDFDANVNLHPNYFGVGHTKLYLEKMCEFFAGRGHTKFTAIRHSNIYGPHDKYDLERSHVFGATVTKVMNADEDVIVWGTGDESRDLLHVDDLVRFVELALEKQPGKYGLYNCGLGEATTVLELVSKVIAASGKKLRILCDMTKPTIKTSLFLDCGKAKKELGWEPIISLDEGIQKTLEWYKNEFLQG